MNTENKILIATVIAVIMVGLFFTLDAVGNHKDTSQYRSAKEIVLNHQLSGDMTVRDLRAVDDDFEVIPLENSYPSPNTVMDSIRTAYNLDTTHQYQTARYIYSKHHGVYTMYFIIDWTTREVVEVSDDAHSFFYPNALVLYADDTARYRYIIGESSVRWLEQSRTRHSQYYK